MIAMIEFLAHKHEKCFESTAKWHLPLQTMATVKWKKNIHIPIWWTNHAMQSDEVGYKRQKTHLFILELKQTKKKFHTKMHSKLNW